MTGKFSPLHPEKYTGQHPIIYKSGLELKFMRYLDRSNKIQYWSYEPTYIHYLDKSSNPPIKRKYYIDFSIQDISGRKIWVEVKHSSEVEVDIKKAKPKELNIWKKNISKWETAKMIAESKGYSFKVITEKELN